MGAVHQVNMHEAKTRLSQLVEQLESGREKEIIIARNGRPVARLIRADSRSVVENRIGVGKGDFSVPEPSPELDTEVERLFIAERPTGENGR
jgi:prevent-host-death family protein